MMQHSITGDMLPLLIDWCDVVCCVRAHLVQNTKHLSELGGRVGVRRAQNAIFLYDNFSILKLNHDKISSDIITCATEAKMG